MRIDTCSRLGALGVFLCSALGCANPAPKQPAAPPQPPTQSPAAAAQGGLRQKVETLLGGYERVPTAEDWQSLGPEALSILEQLYNDPTALPSMRTRAVASMALVANPQAEARLKAILSDAQVAAQYRAAAALALAHRLGPQALPTLERSLQDATPEVRVSTARAISHVGGEAARKLLEDRLGQEEDFAVREAIQQSLTKLEP